MTLSFKHGLTLAALAALSLAAAHSATAQTVVFALPSTGLSFTGNAGGNNLSLGNEFKDSATETVTALGFYDGGSVVNTSDYNTYTRVDIFNQGTGTDVATVNVTSYLTGPTTTNGNQAAGGTQIGQYYFLPVSTTTPDILTPGVTYVNSTFQTSNLGSTTAITNTQQTISDPNVTYTSGHPGVYGFDNPDPTGTAGDAYLSSESFEVASPSPEPSQLAGLGFAAFGVLGLILKARKRTAAKASA